jgi:hypothetical protein
MYVRTVTSLKQAANCIRQHVKMSKFTITCACIKTVDHLDFIIHGKRYLSTATGFPLGNSGR